MEAVVMDAQPVALGEAEFDAFVGAADLAGRVRFAKVNTDEARELAGRHAIRSIPTLLLFWEGREIERVSGAMDARALLRWVGKHV